ncbi:hypothetical protein AAFF_G00023760 [Aldrovandia affinis]|uniref:RUN domain-containing protein n=1 Tax=Aldrovandia affinis TaxID=143900 RepID=A0AAD7WZP2_9TELE|nr:hypothetical protein AAFF_G00023760 [Aldrovandia affinis]
MMDSPPKLSGETLIVHHIPLVHCQVSGHQYCGSVKRPASFRPTDSLSLTRTASLPEQDVLQREALVYSSLIQTSSSSSSSSSGAGLGGGAGCRAGRARGSVASDDSSSFTSNASEEPPPPPTSPCPKSQARGNLLRQNPFLLNREDEEEEEEDEEGHDLNGYLEDSSFHLRGNSNAKAGLAQRTSPFRLRDLGYAPEPFLLHGDLGRAWGAASVRMGTMDGQERVQTGGSRTQVDSLGLPGLEGQRHHGSSGSTLSMDCGEQEWGDEDEEEEEEDEDQHMRSGRRSQACSCCSSSDMAPPNSRRCCCSLTEPFSEGLQPGYGSDSSCNSSDGVLVNFSAIYNKMNNAVPTKAPNLNGSAEQSCTSSSNEPGGAFYLDLHTSPTEPRTANPASCGCRSPQALDANCNSYHVPCEGLSDLTACLQSQARLVVATQNYYKLVTCDLSSQSSPSPIGSSIMSFPEEPQRASSEPTEYFLFRQDEEELSQREEDEEEKREEQDGNDPTLKIIEGQVYVNTSPPTGSLGGPRDGDKGRLRSRSYDRNLDKSPSAQLVSLERMLSCPVRLSEGTAHSPPLAPPRVTSFAEMARIKRRNGSSGSWGAGGAPSLRAGAEASSLQSLEVSPFPELLQLSHSHSLPPLPFTRCYSQGSCDVPPLPHEMHAMAEGGLSSSSEGRPSVVRYRKDQRPTSLPIQPFTFHHQLAKQHNKLLRPLLSEYVSQMQGRAAQEGADEHPREEHRHRQPPAPGSVRPTHPPLRWPTRCPHHDFVPATEFSPLGHVEPGQHCEESEGDLDTADCCSGPRAPNGLSSKQQQNYYSDIYPDYFSLTERPPEEFCLSPDASSESLSIDLLQKRDLHVKVLKMLNGMLKMRMRMLNMLKHMLQSELWVSEWLCRPVMKGSRQPRRDLHLQVKAINTAVDLIVAHFGTSRDPGVKAKLGNSSVSPNVGHLILKYLCPAIRDILQDGLRGYVLDLIIGQRRNIPWSVVEASTQLGPSTRVLHGLYSKVSQYSELTSHSMRLNAFIFGLLNLQSLEFWFHHLYTHEDIIAAHYHPWGVLPLSQGACQPLFEELLLLLQPLSLLPFHLDLLFEPGLLQRGQEHLRRKELLRSAGHGLEQSARSTFQLMRGWSSLGLEPKREVAGQRRDRVELRQEVSRAKRDGGEMKRETFGVRAEGLGREEKVEGLGVRGLSREGERNVTEIGADLRRELGGGGVGRVALRVKGVGGESGRGRDAGETDAERGREPQQGEGARTRDRQAGWWYQLMQSSQIYIDNSAEGSKFVKWEKRKKPAGEGMGGRRLSPPLPGGRCGGSGVWPGEGRVKERGWKK